mgnify:FL=1
MGCFPRTQLNGGNLDFHLQTNQVQPRFPHLNPLRCFVLNLRFMIAPLFHLHQLPLFFHFHFHFHLRPPLRSCPDLCHHRHLRRHRPLPLLRTSRRQHNQGFPLWLRAQGTSDFSFAPARSYIRSCKHRNCWTQTPSLRCRSWRNNNIIFCAISHLCWRGLSASQRASGTCSSRKVWSSQRPFRPKILTRSCGALSRILPIEVFLNPKPWCSPKIFHWSSRARRCSYRDWV